MDTVLHYFISICFIQLLIQYFNIHYILLFHAPISVEQLTKNISIAWRFDFAIILLHFFYSIIDTVFQYSLYSFISCAEFGHPGKASAQRRGGGKREKASAQVGKQTPQSRGTFPKKKTPQSDGTLPSWQRLRGIFPPKKQKKCEALFQKKKHLNSVALCHLGKGSVAFSHQKNKKSAKHFSKKKHLNSVALCHLGKGSAKVIRQFVVCW
jgi:hypothetical protein